MNTLLILASSSPRRIEFVKLLGLPVLPISPSVDETPLKKETPQAMVKRLARLKAEAIVANLDNNFWHTQAKDFKNAVVLSADTTVVSPRGKNLGKPATHQEAVDMIWSLQGKTHSVFTAFCLVEIAPNKKPKSKVYTVKTAVTFQKLSRAECVQYVSKGESMDKAGAYAAQGYGQLLIKKISGSYTNVVGLPMAELSETLTKTIKKYSAFI